MGSVYLQSLVVLLCAFYGSVFVFGKLTLDYAPPLFVTATRMLLAGSLMLAYQFCFKRQEFILKKHHINPILLVGFTGVYLTNALEFWGLQFMESGKACFLYSFSPIATAMLSYAWFSEKITYQKWLGLIIGVLGFIPLLIGHTSQDDSTSSLFNLSLAELALFGAAAVSSIGWVAMRELVKNRSYTPVMANATTMLVGGIISLIHSLAFEAWDPTPISDFWGFLPSFLGLTLVSNLISYNLHAKLLKSFTATYLSFAGLSQPFFAAFLGWLFIGEVLSSYFWVSVVAVSIGLCIYYREEFLLLKIKTQNNTTDLNFRSDID